MEMNNSHQIYCILIEINTPGRSFLSMGEDIKETTHSFCQRGVSNTDAEGRASIA